MSYSRWVCLVLTVILFSLSFVDSATHGHKHHHDDKVIARATTSTVSLVTSTVTVGYGPLLQGSATPCSGSGCATAVPTSSDICPAGNETAWTEFATAQNYTVICDVDFPAQNIHPFVLAGSFEDCMAQCESYNAGKTARDTQCEGFVFAPERVHGADDCYLKFSLDHPFPATISLVGATRLAFSATPIGKFMSSGLFFPLLTYFKQLTIMAQGLLPLHLPLLHLRLL
jgi:hypothetical protein